MAFRFRIPKAMEDLASPPDDDEDAMYAREVVDIESLTANDVNRVVKGVAAELADKDVLCIEDQSLFDQTYSLVRGFDLLPSSARSTLIDSLCTNFVQLNASTSILINSLEDPTEDDVSDVPQLCRSHCNAIKIYSYFLLSMFTSEKAGPEPAVEVPGARGGPKGRSRKKHVAQEWDWGALRNRSLRVVAGALQNNLQLIFESGQLDESLISFFAHAAFKMLEDRELLEKVENRESKVALCTIISACAIKYNYRISSIATLIHLLHKYEHLPVHVADLVSMAENQFSGSSLAADLLRAIGQIDPINFERDNAGADNVGLFLEELAIRLPKVTVTNLSVLMCHLDGKSYKMRNSIVKLTGTLLVKAVKDDDDLGTNELSRLRNEQTLLNILIERSRDISAHTRKHVLQTWAHLCKEHAVSIGHWNLVSDLAAGRLEDNAAIVRKSALQLLGTLLEYNPFGPQLRTAAFEATYEKYKKKLEGMIPPDENINEQLDQTGIDCDLNIQESVVDVSKIDDSDTAIADTIGEIVNAGPESTGPTQAKESVTDSQFSDIGGLEQTRALVASLEAALRFSKCMVSTMPMLAQLLASSTIGDVESTIQLLIVCRQFEVDGSESCLQKIMPLVFSQELGINSAVEEAFKTLYLKKNPSEAASSLIQLTLEASLGDLASIEALISKSMAKGDIVPAMVSALWNFFTFNVEGVTPEHSRGALVVLCMASKSNSKLLSLHLQNILDIGFGRWAKEDVLLARYACIALQRLPEDDRASIKRNHKIFSVLSNLLVGPGLPEACWYSAAEQAINAIYLLHPTPEAFASGLLLKLSQSVFGQGKINESRNDQLGGSPDPVGAETYTQPSEFSSLPVASVSRFLFAVAHIALKHLVYIESCVKRLRKQRGDNEKASANAAAEASDVDASVNGNARKEDNIATELGMAASEDAKLDDLVERAEMEIVSGDSNQKFLISAIAPVVAKLCRNSTIMQQNPGLRSSAMLALCKFMAIDAKFCDKHLQLLFTIAKSSSEDSIRSNCIIALGDIALRFPNLLEPWMNHMYARVHDGSISVRKNTVLVLSHLILNDMIKVKGHISEMAMHLEDEDQRISNLVKLFFHELSKKGNNPIYNLLPDILSRLSSNEALSQQSFNNIMQFLMGTIRKCKQMEGLIEKLCNRFLGASDARQWQSIAYCLAQLTYSQSCVRKLADLFKLYQHALGDDEVIGHFKSLIAKSKKLAKAELKVVLDEFEEKLMACHNEKKEQELALRKAAQHRERTTHQARQAEGSVDAGESVDGVSPEEPSGEGDDFPKVKAEPDHRRTPDSQGEGQAPSADIDESAETAPHEEDDAGGHFQRSRTRRSQSSMEVGDVSSKDDVKDTPSGNGDEAESQEAKRPTRRRIPRVQASPVTDYSGNPSSGGVQRVSTEAGAHHEHSRLGQAAGFPGEHDYGLSDLSGDDEFTADIEAHHQRKLKARRSEEEFAAVVDNVADASSDQDTSADDDDDDDASAGEVDDASAGEVDDATAVENGARYQRTRAQRTRSRKARISSSEEEDESSVSSGSP